jgi:hypothetical protein
MVLASSKERLHASRPSLLNYFGKVVSAYNGSRNLFRASIDKQRALFIVEHKALRSTCVIIVYQDF